MIMVSGERSSITPGATHVTLTRFPGVNPARSSQRPVRRIFGFLGPFQKSPSDSIFKVRKSGCGSFCTDDLLSCNSISFGSGQSRKATTLNSFGLRSFMPPSLTFVPAVFPVTPPQHATPPISDTIPISVLGTLSAFVRAAWQRSHPVQG